MNSALDSATSLDIKKQASPTLGRRFFVWHAWLGFKLSILMTTICLSGTIATVSYELDWLLNPLLRVDPQTTAVDWHAMTDSFYQRYPDGSLTAIEAPLYRNFAAVGTMNVVNENNRQTLRRVFLNPYTGEVLGDLPWYASVQRVMRDFHRFLFIPAGQAVYLVCFFGFVLFISLITGLIVYKKWWRGFFTLRLNRGRRILFGDLHRLLGLWSTWFLLVIAITSIWYFAERLVTDAGVELYQPIPQVAAQNQNENGTLIEKEFIDVNTAMAIAEAEFEQFQIKRITFAGVLPNNNVRPYIVAGETSAILVRPRSNQIIVDPYTGEVLRAYATAKDGLFKRWTDTADSLHFGNFGGLWVKLLWFVFGLILVAMSITGSWMWLRRAALPASHAHVATPMGWSKVVSIVILVLGISLGMFVILVYT